MKKIVFCSFSVIWKFTKIVIKRCLFTKFCWLFNFRCVVSERDLNGDCIRSYSLCVWFFLFFSSLFSCVKSKCLHWLLNKLKMHYQRTALADWYPCNAIKCRQSVQPNIVQCYATILLFLVNFSVLTFRNAIQRHEVGHAI